MEVVVYYLIENMKKIKPHQYRWIKRYQKKLIIKKKKDKIRRRKYLKKQRRENYIQRIEKIKHETYKTINPPEDFSMISNPEGVIKYFNDYRQFIWDGYSIKFDLSTVNSVSFDGIALLTTKIKDKSFRWTSNIKGKNPSDENMRKLFLDSWFFEHIDQQIGRKNIIWKMIHNVTDKKVKSEDAGLVKDEIIQHAWLNWVITKRIYEAIIECMSNTEEHAGVGFDWWLMYYKDQDKKVKVCFIDLWEWIIKSINTKYNEKREWYEKIFSIIRTIKNLFVWENEWQKILKALIESDKEKVDKVSSVPRRERWKWLPSLKAFTLEQNIKNFTIITNDVYANVSNDEYRILKEAFWWTFIYREVHP